MASATFHLLPSTLPDDIPAILEVNERAFRSDRLHQALSPPASDQKATREVRESRLQRTIGSLMGKALPRLRPAKIVATQVVNGGLQTKLVAQALWYSPKSSEEAAEEEAAAAKEKAQEPPAITHGPISDEELVERKRRQIGREVERLNKAKTKELLGEDCDQRYWYLASLATDPDYQRMGFGSQLVKWGIDLATAEAVAKPGTVTGLYLISSLEGMRTYEKAGMNSVGELVVDHGEGFAGNGHRFIWMVKTF